MGSELRTAESGETRGLQAEKAGWWWWGGALGDLPLQGALPPQPHLQLPGFPPLSLSSFLQALEEPLTADSSSSPPSVPDSSA